jgi:polyvinyl alcohol dehydrogenase (cytochrome)
VRRWAIVTAVSAAAAVAAVVPRTSPAATTSSAPIAIRPAEFVLGPEGNHLWAYEAATGQRQLVSRAQNGGDPGVAPPAGSAPRDINGQVCVAPDGGHVITGEDTVIATGGGGSSHDPRIAGWGWFALSGARLGDIRIDQVGKLAPEAGEGPGYTGDPDNYGCGFLDAGRLLTTAIGDTLPGQPANGQLFLWFGPFDTGFRQETLADGTAFFVGEVPHCEIDHTLATAGGIAVDPSGDVYVATNRPDDQGNAGGVWRYRGTFPTSMAECTPEFLAANVTKELVVPMVEALPADLRAVTPSAVALTGHGTMYVSSVFTGTVSEFTTDGAWVRDVWPLAPLAPPTGPTGNTPFGLAVTGDGDLWIADLGIVLASPLAGAGSVVRVRFDAAGNPAPLGETVQDGLTFPDGLGVYRPATPLSSASSEWPCGNWGMLGRTLTRTFSTECPSRIAPATVAGLRHAWTFRVPLEIGDQGTFTASPTVVGGVVYVGGWNGIVYALDADDGSVLWEHDTVPAGGATYGPVVSTAAVADLDMPGLGLRRVVVVGAGPRLYALDAADGSELWVRSIGTGTDGEPAEIESSPVIWSGTVFVGMDVHNKDGETAHGIRGGLLAVDAATGAVRWKYEPEVAAGQPASGCGGVWGSPVVDPETALVYFGTANCPAVNDNPALPMEEITALHAADGTAAWTFRPHQPPDEDQDFGATPNLYVDTNGRKVLGAGSKDGSYYALDPATGAVLWNTKVSTPAPGVGGFIGSPAVWRGSIFGATAIGTLPAYHSLDGATGAVRWQGGLLPSYGASAVVNGVVFAGALDTTFKAYDAATGRILWLSPTLGAVSSAPVVVGDMVFVGSGTSTSDACAKGRPTDELCVTAFDTLLGQQGGLHAFRLAPVPLPLPKLPGGLAPR